MNMQLTGMAALSQATSKGRHDSRQTEAQKVPKRTARATMSQGGPGRPPSTHATASTGLTPNGGRGRGPPPVATARLLRDFDEIAKPFREARTTFVHRSRGLDGFNFANDELLHGTPSSPLSEMPF